MNKKAIEVESGKTDKNKIHSLLYIFGLGPYTPHLQLSSAWLPDFCRTELREMTEAADGKGEAGYREIRIE